MRDNIQKQWDLFTDKREEVVVMKKIFDKRFLEKITAKIKIKKVKDALIGIFSSACLLGIISCLSLLLQAKDSHENTPLPPDITVSEEVSIEYLDRQGYDVDHPYMLFKDDLSEDRKHSLQDYCATVVAIANHYDEEIHFQKIFLEAMSIQKDSAPYLTIYFQSASDFNGVEILIKNIGWESTDPATLVFSCENPDFFNYIPEAKLHVDIPSLNSGEYMTIPFLSNDDLIKSYNEKDDYKEFLLTAVCIDNSDKEIEIKNADNGFELCIGLDAVWTPARGGGNPIVFGMRIDANRSEYYDDDEITDTIGAGEVKLVPIVFYPNYSCNMEFRFGFEIIHNGEPEVIYSNIRNLDFFIDPSNDLVKNAKEYSEQEIEQIGEQWGDYYVSYPYN